MGKYDQDAEETATAKAIEDGATPEAFVASWTPDAAFDPLEFLLRGAEPSAQKLRAEPHAMPSVFKDTETFMVAALDELTASKRTRSRLDVRRNEDKHFIEFSMPDDLARRYRRVPAEVPVPEGRVQLTADRAVMQQAIRAARSNDAAWPELQYLWELHPAVTWARDRMRALFGRHEAPILDVNRLAKDERVLIVSGLIPNRRGQPVVHRWYAAVFRGKKFSRLEDLDALLTRTKLGAEPLANTGRTPGDLQELVAEAVKQVRERVITVRTEEEVARAARIGQVRAELTKLRERKEQQIALTLAGRGAQRDQEQRNVKRTFDEFESWVQDTLATEPQPFLQVIAALRGAS